MKNGRSVLGGEMESRREMSVGRYFCGPLELLAFFDLLIEIRMYRVVRSYKAEIQAWASFCSRYIEQFLMIEEQYDSIQSV